jgi:hypothetical protein
MKTKVEKSWRWHFGTSVHMNLLRKMHEKQILKYQKFRAQIPHVRSDILCWHISFRAKQTFLFGICKKTKECPVNTHIGASEFVLCTWGTQNIPLPRLVCEHKISRYTCTNLFQNLLILMYYHKTCSYAPVSQNGCPRKLFNPTKLAKGI